MHYTVMEITLLIMENHGIVLLIFGGNPAIIMAKCEDPDEMQHYAAFHQCLQCLQRQTIWLNPVAQLVETGD